MYYGDLLALVIATLGTGVVLYYAECSKDDCGKSKGMKIVTRVLLSTIVFLWIGFGLLWLS
jgi:hypothetical protein